MIDVDFLKQYEELEQRGKPKILHRLIDRFFEAAPEKLATLNRALIMRDEEQLKFEAHALRNICLNVGAVKLAQSCLRLEQFYLYGTIQDTPVILSEVIEECERATPILKAIRSQ